MTEEEYSIVVHQIDVLHQLMEKYSYKTIDNVLYQLEARVINHDKKAER